VGPKWKDRGDTGIEPVTSCTQSRNHTTRPITRARTIGVESLALVQDSWVRAEDWDWIEGGGQESIGSIAGPERGVWVVRPRSKDQQSSEVV
jgi:hypothetical protein